MRALTVMLLMCVAWTPMRARAQSLESLQAKAQQAFQEGIADRGKPLLARRHFSQAADLYLALHETGLRSPSLYLNLGNAALLADRWPEALWAYHLGLNLDPNDRQLRAHRDFVRAKVLYPSSNQGRPQPDTWPAWLYRPSPSWLAALACFAYVLAWLAGTGAFLWHRPLLVKAAALTGVAAIASGACLWYELDQADTDRATPLLIVKENTPFYRGNGVNYSQHPDLPSLPRGMEAREQHRRGAWLQIRLSTGEVGWLPRERVLAIEP